MELQMRNRTFIPSMIGVAAAVAVSGGYPLELARTRTTYRAATMYAAGATIDGSIGTLGDAAASGTVTGWAHNSVADERIVAGVGAVPAPGALALLGFAGLGARRRA